MQCHTFITILNSFCIYTVHCLHRSHKHDQTSKKTRKTTSTVPPEALEVCVLGLRPLSPSLRLFGPSPAGREMVLIVCCFS